MYSGIHIVHLQCIMGYCTDLLQNTCTFFYIGKWLNFQNDQIAISQEPRNVWTSFKQHFSSFKKLFPNNPLWTNILMNFNFFCMVPTPGGLEPTPGVIHVFRVWCSIHCATLHGIKPLRLNGSFDSTCYAQGRKQVIHINVLQYLLTPLLA